jgi:signal transduction histidine kinase
MAAQLPEFFFGPEAGATKKQRPLINDVLNRKFRPIMKLKMLKLSRRYVAALRKHLRRRTLTNFISARGLGRLAVAFGLETLDMARIHEAALVILNPPANGREKIKRAELFFSEAIIPIEATHLAALQTKTRLSDLHDILGRRALELAASRRSLERVIMRRKTAEHALKKSGKHSRKLLRESEHLQKHLQNLTRQVLCAQENRRKRISHALQDEIAQTLLGINVRLLALRKEATLRAKSLIMEITGTQRLIDRSLKTIHRFAREYTLRHEC